MLASMQKAGFLSVEDEEQANRSMPGLGKERDWKGWDQFLPCPALVDINVQCCCMRYVTEVPMPFWWVLLLSCPCRLANRDLYSTV